MFQLANRVYVKNEGSCFHGKIGTIVEINENEPIPIRVEFDTPIEDVNDCLFQDTELAHNDTTEEYS